MEQFECGHWEAETKTRKHKTQPMCDVFGGCSCSVAATCFCVSRGCANAHEIEDRDKWRLRILLCARAHTRMPCLCRLPRYYGDVRVPLPSPHSVRAHARTAPRHRKGPEAFAARYQKAWKVRALSTRILGKTTRDADRNKVRRKRIRTPTLDLSTNLADRSLLARPTPRRRRRRMRRSRGRTRPSARPRRSCACARARPLHRLCACAHCARARSLRSLALKTPPYGVEYPG